VFYLGLYGLTVSKPEGTLFSKYCAMMVISINTGTKKTVIVNDFINNNCLYYSENLLVSTGKNRLYYSFEFKMRQLIVPIT
jgi:midasin (ATPase involved in ribosome maturation)